MKKTTNDLTSHVMDKGLVINKYKGEYQAKRVMMRAGLPVDVIESVLFQDKKKPKRNYNNE